MALVDARGFQLVPDVSPLTQRIGQALQSRRKIAREDELIAKKAKVAQVKDDLLRTSVHADRIRDIKDPMAKRTEIAKLSQELISQGKDASMWTDLLQETNPDQINLGLTRIFTNTGDASTMFAQALKEDKAEQFEPVLDAKGNIVAQRNVRTGKVIKDPRAIARADKVSLGEVKSSKILDDGTVINVMKDGSTTVTDSSGVILSDGETRTSAIRDAQEFGVDIQQRRAKGRELGKGAGKIALTSFESAGKIKENVLDLKRGINLIEKEGARTGFISDFLPSMKASTRKFDNLRRKLGLNVVASVTFGALSEGELNLAMDVALPKGMSQEATVKWIKDRVEAQEKLAANLEDAALYLSDHSVADLIRRNRAMKKSAKKKAEVVPVSQPQAQPTILRFNPATGKLE